jgi:hypothetical protein
MTTPRATLIALGYDSELIDEVPIGRVARAVTGYALPPKTKRNACVTLVDLVEQEGGSLVAEVARETGAAIVGVVIGNVVELWRIGANGEPNVIEGMDQAPLDALQDVGLFDPRSVHRAKTYGAYDQAYQLAFVDTGLLLGLEAVQGHELKRLLERIVRELRRPEDDISDEVGHQVLTIAFWLLAARMLHDHGVPAFSELRAGRGVDALEAVGRHYGGIVPMLARVQTGRVQEAWTVAWTSGLNLSRIGPEAIGYVYESTLVADATRNDLGTHSTPPQLVEYIVGRLRSRIRAIAPSDRIVAEPACGHGAFMVSALRVLAEDLPGGVRRHAFLRERLRGIEIDNAAREMARLSLTLADVPNPDGWDLRDGDMFVGDALARLAAGATILLTNPPFEDFDADERERLGSPPTFACKASEVLWRCLPELAPGAVVGAVLPRSFLGSHQDRRLRKQLLTSFQVLEVCTFPDGMFTFADQECAVVLAQKSDVGTVRPVLFRRVWDGGIKDFLDRARFSYEEAVPASVLRDNKHFSLAVPDMRPIWSCRRWPSLGDLATVHRGLEYHGWVTALAGPTSRPTRADGFDVGLAKYRDSAKLPITRRPRYCFMDVNPEHVRRWLGGAPSHLPQVVVNYHPRSRGVWKLGAFIDPLGAAVPTTYTAVRPHDHQSAPVEVLWAFCNSPFANAYVYAHSGKRDIYSKVLEAMPVPCLSIDARDQLVRTVRDLMAKDEAGDITACTRLLAEVDALVMAGYGLFAPTELRLFDLLAAQPRPGFDFPVPDLPRGRLPSHLSVGVATSEFPLERVLGEFASSTDMDAEIRAGRDELAALRAIPAPRRDGNVSARLAYVRAALAALEEHAAERFVAPLPHPITALLAAEQQ